MKFAVSKQSHQSGIAARSVVENRKIRSFWQRQVTGRKKIVVRSLITQVYAKWFRFISKLNQKIPQKRQSIAESFWDCARRLVKILEKVKKKTAKCASNFFHQYVAELLSKLLKVSFIAYTDCFGLLGGCCPCWCQPLGHRRPFRVSRQPRLIPVRLRDLKGHQGWRIRKLEERWIRKRSHCKFRQRLEWLSAVTKNGFFYRPTGS